MNGILLVNKPAGITSFDLVRQLRPLTGVRKIGHAGTLDPAAEGLMIMLIGSACKQADQFLKLDKTYLAQIKLGQESETGDSEGPLHNISDRVPTAAEVEAALQTFLGSISQTPSAFSAIKIGGRPAYKAARQGQKVAIPPRKVTIYSLELKGYDYPQLELEVAVSSGTYIRTLAADIGRKLGTGAYLSGLRRTVVGPYRLEQAARLEGLDSQQIEAKLLKV